MDELPPDITALKENYPTVDWRLDQRRLIISDSWLEATGYSQADLPKEFPPGLDLTRSLDNLVDQWGEYLHPDDREQAIATLKNYLLNLSPTYSSYYRFRKKDGSYMDIWSRGEKRTDSEGRLIGFLATHVDVTKLKQQQREVTEQLQAANAELNQLRQNQGNLAQQLESYAKVVDGLVSKGKVFLPILGSILVALSGGIQWVYTGVSKQIYSFQNPAVVAIGKHSLVEGKPQLPLLMGEVIREGVDRVVIGVYDDSKNPKSGIIIAQAFRKKFDPIPMSQWSVNLTPTLQERTRAHLSSQVFDINSNTAGLIYSSVQISAPGKVIRNNRDTLYYVGVECEQSSKCLPLSEMKDLLIETRNKLAFTLGTT